MWLSEVYTALWDIELYSFRLNVVYYTIQELLLMLYLSDLLSTGYVGIAPDPILAPLLWYYTI